MGHFGSFGDSIRYGHWDCNHPDSSDKERYKEWYRWFQFDRWKF